MDVPDAVTRKRVPEVWPIAFIVPSPDLNEGETIQSCTAEVTPAGLTLDPACVIDEDQVSVGISGGVAGSDYVVRFKPVISSGKKPVYDYLVHVVK